MIEDTKLLISKTDDMITAVLRGRPMAFSCFLTVDEQKLVCDHISHTFLKSSVFGGFSDFERGMVCVYDDFEPKHTDFPITVLTFDLTDWEEINHRDVLGSLMSLGIKRELIGDIVFESGHCFIFVDKKISSYIIQNMFSVRSQKINIVEYFGEITCSKKYEEVQIIVSSERIDCFIGELCSLSRTKASDLIVGGQVFLNGKQEFKKDRSVQEGDILTIRRHGKYRVEECFGVTKKGRIKIKLLKYK